MKSYVCFRLEILNIKNFDSIPCMTETLSLPRLNSACQTLGISRALVELLYSYQCHQKDTAASWYEFRPYILRREHAANGS